jgi:hypothetical protein
MTMRGMLQLDPAKPLEFRPDEGGWTAGIILEHDRLHVLLTEVTRIGPRGERLTEHRAEFHDYERDGNVAPEPIYRTSFAYLMPKRDAVLVQASVDFAMALDEAAGGRFGTMTTADLQQRLHRLNRAMVADGSVRPIPDKTAELLEASDVLNELKRRRRAEP